MNLSSEKSNMSKLFTAACLVTLFATSPSQAAYILDCGNPASDQWNTNGFKADFNADGKVYLIISFENESEKKIEFRPTYATKDITHYFSGDPAYGSIAILRNKNGLFLNTNYGLGSHGHSECK